MVTVYRRQLLRLRLARSNYNHPRRHRLCGWLCFQRQDDCGHGPDRCELQIRGIRGRVINSLTQSELTETPSLISSGFSNLALWNRPVRLEQTLAHVRRLLALNGHRRVAHCTCPLLGVKRTWRADCGSDIFPKWLYCCVLSNNVRPQVTGCQR